MENMEKIGVWSFYIGLIIVLLLIPLFLLGPKEAENITWGINFSQKQALKSGISSCAYISGIVKETSFFLFFLFLGFGFDTSCSPACCRDGSNTCIFQFC